MTTLLDIQYRIEYVLLRLLVGFIRLMPLDTAANFSAFCWRNIAPRTRRHRRAMENLALAYPEKSDAERRKIALAMWDNLGRVMVETMQIDRVLADEERLEFLNERMFAPLCRAAWFGRWRYPPHRQLGACHLAHVEICGRAGRGLSTG